METSYLLPYLFSAADCGRDGGWCAKATKTHRVEEDWQARVAPPLPGGHHQGNWIRHFSNPTPQTLVCGYVRPVAPKNRIFVPKRLVLDNQITSFLLSLMSKTEKIYDVEL